MREHWTDDRMDDLVKRMDDGFAQVHADIAALRVDNREIRRELAGLGTELRGESKALGDELRSEMKALGGELRGEMKAQAAELNRRFDHLQMTILAAIFAAFLSVVVTNVG